MRPPNRSFPQLFGRRLEVRRRSVATSGSLMNLRPLGTVCRWVALVMGILAMPAGFVIGIEDGPMPAQQLWRQKAIAKTVLLAGGVVAMLAACGLYAIGRLG